MRRIHLSGALCCLLIAGAFADFNWTVDSGVWSVGTNWNTGYKPDGTQHVVLNRSNAVCTLNTDEGLIAAPNNRLTVGGGFTLNIENGGRIGMGWSRVGRNTAATVNMSGNGAFVLNNDDLYIGVDAGGNCQWTMSGTSSVIVNAATTGGDNIYIAQNDSTGKLKLIGSQVTVLANEVLIADAKTAATNPVATIEFVLDANGASRVVADTATRIVNGTAGANAKAHLLLSAPGVTLAPVDIVLIECTGGTAITGKGVFDTLNGGSAAEGTPVILGGNLYTLTYKYAVTPSVQNDVALVFVRSAAHMAHTPVPANQSVLMASPTTLSWTNPDPNDGVSPITCTVYFGLVSEPNRPQMDSVTLAPNASSVTINVDNFENYGVQPLTNKATYYWIVDVSDPSASPADGLGLSWKFSTDFNDAPTVNAGPDQAVWLGKSGIADQEVVSLAGAVTDDDLPNPPAACTLQWTQVSGPATVTFTPANAASSNVTITVAGTYVFQLTADDTDKQASDTVQIIVGSDSCHASYLNGRAYNSKDFNHDCVVDLTDLQDFAADWLACTNTAQGCF